jgi:hypothetical protein
MLSLLLAVAVLLPAAAWAAGRTSVHTTLKGSCTTTNKLDANGVMVRSTVVCSTKGTCFCGGATTHLVYASTWTSPGNGDSGPEHGTLTATAKSTTVTLALKGKRTGSGQSQGTWVLKKVSGAPKSRFRSRGTYTSTTLEPGTDQGPTAAARVTASIDCWSC